MFVDVVGSDEVGAALVNIGKFGFVRSNPPLADAHHPGETDWIQTSTGVRFKLARPTPDMVDCEDIGHALANLCRFNGHCRRFYSVAQHSWEAANRIIPHLDMLRKEGKYLPELDSLELHAVYLEILLHDAGEAYLGDMTRPLKKLVAADPKLAQIGRGVDLAIREKFGLPVVQSEAMRFLVRTIDARMLATEKRDVMRHSIEWGYTLPEPFATRIMPIDPHKAKGDWLSMFTRFWSVRGVA